MLFTESGEFDASSVAKPNFLRQNRALAFVGRRSVAARCGTSEPIFSATSTIAPAATHQCRRRSVERSCLGRHCDRPMHGQLKLHVHASFHTSTPVNSSSPIQARHDLSSLSCTLRASTSRAGRSHDCSRSAPITRSSSRRLRNSAFDTRS